MVVRIANPAQEAGQARHAGLLRLVSEELDLPDSGIDGDRNVR